MEKRWDLAIIGSGPAGLAAAVYAQRAQLSALVIEKEYMGGGQVLSTYEVDNYPGFPNISGFELGEKFFAHARALGAEFVTDEISGIEADGAWKRIIGKKDIYSAKAVIIATGASYRRLGAPGEETLRGAGVSYCATCDGAFFRGKSTAVIGGGNTALEDALYLARMCGRVYLIHRRDALRGARALQKKVLASDKIEVIWDSVAEAITGDGRVDGLDLLNKKTGARSHLPVDGVFIAVGTVPNSAPFAGLVDMQDGYIKADETCITSAPGIFAAGDVRSKQLRQIVTAAADGANAVTSAERYLTESSGLF